MNLHSYRIFSNADDMRSCFYIQHRRNAKQLANPEFLRVHFHSFRHWKATTEYHNTKDRLYVAELLGHRNIEITRGYIKVEKALNKNANNVDFHTKVAKTQGEIIQLLDGGFDYILEKDGLAYFRKRR